MQRIIRLCIKSIACIILVLLLISCVSYKTAKILQGVWVGDSDKFLTDPEIKKVIENSPLGDKIAAYFEALVSNLRIEISPNTILIFEQPPGESPTKIVISYRVIQETKNMVTFENTNSSSVRGKMIARIIDVDHIKISLDKIIEGHPDFILKRSL